jgi:hypothetical protein
VVNCSIPKANGTLKGVMTDNAPTSGGHHLVFEDAAGTIRIISMRCGVEYKFDRQ